MGKTLRRTIPVEGGEVVVYYTKRWRKATVGFVLSQSPYRLSRGHQEVFRSLPTALLVSAESVISLSCPVKQADSLADYFEGFVREHVLSEPPIEGARREAAESDPSQEMPAAGEFFMAYTVAGYILDEGYSLSKAIKQTARDVDAEKKWFPQFAVSRVTRWIATGSPERPDEDLPYYMIEERESLEHCLLQLAGLDASEQKP